MRVSTKGHYAVRALIDLASNGGMASLQEISQRQLIDYHILECLFRKLRVGSLVRPVTGSKMKYALARNPENISVKDILLSAGEELNLSRDIISVQGSDFCTQKTKSYFKELSELMDENLSKTTLKSLMESP